MFTLETLSSQQCPDGGTFEPVREAVAGDTFEPESATLPPSVRRESPFGHATVAPLETPFRHALHAYQGLCPWSPDGRRLLYCGFEDAGQTGSIVIRDLSTGEDTVVGETPHYDFHTAAYQQWALGGKGVVYRDVADGCLGTAFRPAPNETAPAAFFSEIRIRAVAPKGLWGYGQFAGKTSDGAARVEISTGRTERCFSASEAALHLPADLQADCAYSMSHFVPNAEESLAFIKLSRPEPHRQIPGRMPDWGAFFVFDLENQNFRCLGQRISGHPQWMPDGRHVLNVMQPLDGSDNRWIVLQDAITGKVERLVDFPIEGPGHPVVSPCGKFLATDAYTASREACPIYLIEISTGRMKEIARFAHTTKITDTYQPHTIGRSNLHPVWSPDGRQLLVNVNGGGDRLGMFLLKDFLT